MSTKTISLRLEAYERLRRARLHPGESFSDVVMRARWLEGPPAAGDYLAQIRECGALYSEREIDAIETADAGDRPATDKWCGE